MKVTPKHADRAGSASRGGGCRRVGVSIRGTNVVADHQLPWLSLPVQTLRAEKYVGDNGDPARRNRTAAPHRSGTSGIDSTASNRAATISSRAGAGSFPQRLGNWGSAVRLDSVPR